jgi:8-oxo-dGTP pyrophosphatase MutT (NUDIX family)
MYNDNMKQDDSPWRTLDSRVVYKNPWMKVHEDSVLMPSGAKSIYGYLEAKPGVLIIALTDDYKMYLIESFRYPTQKWQWELPSGGIEPDTSPTESAKHELAEELGMTADKWSHVNTYSPTHNGLMKDSQDVFVAEQLHMGKTHHEDFEAIRAIKAVPVKEVMEMVKNGRLADGQTLAALMQFIAWRDV